MIENEEDIVDKLLTRARIRRSIPRSEPDRISEMCEEAAKEILKLREAVKAASRLIYGDFS